jgi:hypothetical protein
MECLVGLRHGKQDGYGWVCSVGGRLEQVLERVPELVVGRTLAVTACDSGFLIPTPLEIDAGWMTRADVAFSPVIEDLGMAPICGWDEWYVLDQRRHLGSLRVFVNSSGFAPAPVQPALGYGWDESVAAALHQRRLHQAAEFWCQLRSVRPLSFIANGDNLIVATRLQGLHAKVLAALA